MSLINDMLRDLDRRHGGAGALPNEVRPLPPDRSRSPALPLLLLVLVGCVAAAGWFFMEWKSEPSAATVAPAAKMAEPPPAPVAVMATGEPAPPQETTALRGGLRLDVSLSPPSQAAASAERPSAPTAGESAAIGEPPASALTKPPQAPVARASEPATSVSEMAGKAAQPTPPAHNRVAREIPAAVAGGIEKRPRIETPRERAEQDYRKAYSLLSRGRAEEAMPLLRNALAEEATHVSARLALAGMLAQSGRHDEALALLDEGLQIEPARPPLALAAARLLVAKGHFDRAAQVLSRAASSAQADAEFRAFHAAVLQRLTFHKEAMAEYQAALRLAPQAGVWWMGLAISLEADGKPTEAREAYLRAKGSASLSPELSSFVEQKLRQIQ